MDARPLPPGQGRRFDWATLADRSGAGDGEHTAWLWRAVAHWTAGHGDPDTGCQPLSATVGRWLGIGGSRVTSWRKGTSWEREWFVIVRTKVGCDQATCPSPYADEDELAARLLGAEREREARRAARSRTASADPPGRPLPAARSSGAVGREAARSGRTSAPGAAGVAGAPGTPGVPGTGRVGVAGAPSVPRGAPDRGSRGRTAPGPVSAVPAQVPSASDDGQDIPVALRRVALADRRTVAAWEAVVPLVDDPGKAAVSLGDVYVPRRAQKALVRGLRDQAVNRGTRGSAVLGEPGTGKSCVLWGVRRDLRAAGWTVVAVSAAALLGTPAHPADLRLQDLLTALEAKLPGPGGPRPAEGRPVGNVRGVRGEAAPGGGRAARSRRPAGPVALLLDTADLLLHDAARTGEDLLVRLVREARALGVAVAVACRSAEARRLEDREREDRERDGVEALLTKEHLAGYDDGRTAASPVRYVGAPWEPGSELDLAVEAHLRVFCREPGRPGPREGGGAPDAPAEPLARRMRSTLVYAAARGLPLGQLIRHPLSLRMLFDVYAPAGPRDKDLDVTELFREYWEARVTEDVRHSVPAPGDADGHGDGDHGVRGGGGGGPAGEHARRDLSDEVRALGLAVLRAGTPELHRADALSALVAHTPLRRRRDAAEAVAVLLNRGVLRRIEGGRIAFHHQAFAEHAAGQALRSARRGLDAAARRVTEHPDDLLLAEAVRHAFHNADRDGAAGWYPALETLTRHEHAATRLTALRVHAGLRHPPGAAVDLVVETLRDADPWQTASYTAVLTGTSNPARTAWPRTLRAVWDREDDRDRRRVLVAVTHLAHQQPDEAASFLTGLGLLDFARPEHLGCLPHGRDLTLFLLGLHTAAPQRCAIGLTRLLEAAAAFRDKAVLLHGLVALAHLADRYPARYSGHAASLPGLLDGLGKGWQGDLDKLVEAAAPAWAGTLRGATADEVEALASELAGRLEGGPPRPSDVLRLRSLAEVLAARPRRTVQTCLTRLADAATSPERAEPVAKYLLAPLLRRTPDDPKGGPAGAPAGVAAGGPSGGTSAGPQSGSAGGAARGPQGGSTGAAAARDWCRSHLSPTRAPDVARGAAGVVVKALDADKVPLPAATVAACLPAPRDADAAALGRWLSDPWPASLTVAAAAGGHPHARRALDTHLAANPPATGPYAVRLREALGRRAADHPGPLLGRLRDDAARSGDLSGLRRLAGLGPDMLAAVLDSPGHREALLTVAKILRDSPTGLKAAGVRLQTLAATRGGLLPVTVEETAELLTATRNGEVRRGVLAGVGEQLHRHAAHWRGQDPLGRLLPVLDAVQERGREVRAASGPPYDHHSRQFLLAANEAYLLRIALHAHFDDLAHPADEPLGALEALVFAELPLFLPPGDRETAPHAWRRRFEHLPHLCRRLAAEGRGAQARGLLDRVLDFTNRVHPAGKGKWRDGLANDWRRYLRVVGLEDRERLTDTILDLAVRDVAFAKQLVEVAGQSLGDISPELYALMRDRRTPPALMPALRGTASWAGRAGHGAPWAEVFADVA
ncbi:MULTISPECIES: hypothetical protein [Streptomyces]|uniref:Uncharacterized protein n=1 Tax=Streptomyces fradiae ATCC 10745 = DSM 40063 TaxID=1319510 RepID=A0A1Y2P363_STRFR|nr:MULTISPECIES: hypothetical protein [Streptomyces]OSY54236.1 hypothetical protein BG846_00083 [Streptomyces fradiae ATCC 10745 = DSM 40063]QEV14588.1 hypothetical protein CP974_24320 [Streptomyces fradiae ATCC 10745 = DSM 40063]